MSAEVQNPPPPQLIALVRDLIFGSRISGAAKSLGVPLRTVRDPAMLAAVPGRRLLVDLNLAGTIEAAAAWKAAEPGREVIGFVSHVDTQTINLAREQGIDKVLARSRFVELLPQYISS